jgi:hypothetical protein
MCTTLTCLLMARMSRYCAPRLRHDFEILRTPSPIAVVGRSNAAAQLFGSRVRTPLGAWMFVACVM